MGLQFYGAQDFQPKFFTGGLTRFYLPLLFDIVGQEKPRLIVTLGLGDAQPHLTFCQAVLEQNLSSRCIAVRRIRADESALDDPAWQSAQNATAELFATVSQLAEADPVKAATDFVEASIDVLLIDDIDSGETMRQELDIWQSKLSANALILLHGTDLDRKDGPRRVWEKFVTGKAVAYFREGIGLSVATAKAAANASLFRKALFCETNALAHGYRLIAESTRARAETRQIERRNFALEARQTWFDTIVEDRIKAQNVIEHQELRIGELAERFSMLSKDRADAQLVMENQFVQIQKLHAKVTEQREALVAGKAACRNKG